jgi:monomeric sarcosine oxidase
VLLDAVVVGAGIHGLCAAFHLRRRGLRVTVLEQFGHGNNSGSSHGMTRIIRSSYHDPRYVRLAKKAHQEGWPLLEQELHTTLLHRTNGLFFGPEQGLFADYLRATLGSGADVQRIPVDLARAKFPLFLFRDDDAVMLDHTAGLLSAEETMRGLLAWCGEHEVEVRDNTKVNALHSEDSCVQINTSHGVLFTRRVVLACGAWLAKLIPELQPQLSVIPQEVGYFELDAPSEATRVFTFPVWARIGADATDFRYGLPEFGQAGVKCAQHKTTGAFIDPDALRKAPDEAQLLQLARTTFNVKVRGLLATESCLYTMAPEEHFILRHHHADTRIAIVSACSGHGFKFGPVIGKEAADLLA